MGWELRDGRRYLYRNRRVNGRPVKEYLAADDRFGFGALMADDLERLRRRYAKVRRLTQTRRAEYRDRIDGLLADAAAANAELRTATDGLLTALGYHRHNRGEWRMRREMMTRKTLMEALKPKNDGPNPLVK